MRLSKRCPFCDAVVDLFEATVPRSEPTFDAAAYPSRTLVLEHATPEFCVFPRCIDLGDRPFDDVVAVWNARALTV